MLHKLALIWLLWIYLSSFLTVNSGKKYLFGPLFFFPNRLFLLLSLNLLDKYFVSCFQILFLVLEDFVSSWKNRASPAESELCSSDTNFSIGKIMLAQQRASFVAGRLRLLWHNFQVEYFWQTQHQAPRKPYFRETSSPLIPLFDVGDFVPSKYYFLW